MKKLMTVFLASALLLVGCGTDKDKDKDTAEKVETSEA